MCKITHWVKNYSLCVKSHTVCEITDILQDSTGDPFAFNIEKIPLTKIFYTHAVGGMGDKYEVWYSTNAVTLN